MSSTEQVTMTRAELEGLVRDAHAQGWRATTAHRRELEAWESSDAAKRVQELAAVQPASAAARAWSLPEYAAADAARNAALAEDANDHMAALAAAVDAAVVSVLGDMHDVLTHRQAWRDCISGLSQLTNDDNGSGYLTHELKAYDRTFDHLARLAQRAEGGGPVPGGAAYVQALQARLMYTQAQLRGLQAAAEPFVAHYQDWMDQHTGHMSSFARVTYEQVRALRGLLAPGPNHRTPPAALNEQQLRTTLLATQRQLEGLRAATAPALALVGRMVQRTRPGGHYATGPLPDDYAEALRVAQADG